MTGRRRSRRSGSDGGGFHAHLHDGDIRAVPMPATLREHCGRCGSDHRLAEHGGSEVLRRVIGEELFRTTGFRPEVDALFACRLGASAALRLALGTLPRYSSLGVFSPLWFGFLDIARDTEHSVFTCSLERNAYRGTGELLEETISVAAQNGDPIRGVVLNNMATPVGRAWGSDELRELGEVILRHPDITVIEDCLFWQSAFPGRQFHTLAKVVPELLERDQLIGLASLSKGWPLGSNALGFLWAHRKRLKAIGKLSRLSELTPRVSEEVCAGDALVGSGREVPGLLRHALAQNAARLGALCRSSHLQLAQVPDGGTNALLDLSGLVERRYQGSSLCCADCVCGVLHRDFGVTLYPGHHFNCHVPAARVNLAGATPADFADACGALQEFSDATD